jgi:hypothetical protein
MIKLMIKLHKGSYSWSSQTYSSFMIVTPAPWYDEAADDRVACITSLPDLHGHASLPRSVAGHHNVAVQCSHSCSTGVSSGGVKHFWRACKLRTLGHRRGLFARLAMAVLSVSVRASFAVGRRASTATIDGGTTWCAGGSNFFACSRLAEVCQFGRLAVVF